MVKIQEMPESPTDDDEHATSLSSKVKAFLTISRAKIQLGTPPHPLLGLILGATFASQLISKPALLYLALYFLLITFACNINCLFDVDIDKKYKHYMSDAVQTVGKRNVKILLVLEAALIFVLVTLLFDMGHIITPILALSGLFFGYVYSADPIRVKKRGFWSPFPVLIGLYTLPVLGGWFIFQNSLSLYIIVFAIGYAFLNEGITLVNTCEDYREDMAEGIKTWAHVFSLKRTVSLAFLFTIVGGLLAVLGVVLKPFLSGFSNYNIYSSIAFIAMGIINTLLILKTSGDIFQAKRSDDLESSCKNAAKNMPKWFITTRYPLLMMGLLILYCF